MPGDVLMDELERKFNAILPEQPLYYCISCGYQTNVKGGLIIQHVDYKDDDGKPLKEKWKCPSCRTWNIGAKVNISINDGDYLAC